MTVDHLALFGEWRLALKTGDRARADLIRVRGFTSMPPGPENALALFVWVEEFRALAGDSITDNDRYLAWYALRLSELALMRSMRVAA